MKKNGFYESECERSPKKTARKDVEHSLLRVLGADLNHLLAVGNGSFGRAVKF